MKNRWTPALLLWMACAPPESSDSAAGVGDGADSVDTGPQESPSDDTAEEEHPLGEAVADFALVDINPSSASYKQAIASSDFEGQAYSVIFLDSRCITCIEVIEDLWAELVANPSWEEQLPLFAIQSVGGAEMPETLERMIEGHDLPYLQDTEDVALWHAYEAMNHDFFAVSAEGNLDAWLPLYVWPDDLTLYQDYMQSRFD